MEPMALRQDAVSMARLCDEVKFGLLGSILGI
jgi:hypothetical protein